MLETIDDTVINSALARSNAILSAQAERKRSHDALSARLNTKKKELDDLSREYDLLLRASVLAAETSDDIVNSTLDIITGVINKALALIFPKSKRWVAIKPHMHNNVHPHFVVKLYVGEDGDERTFKQSGTGVAQVVSFLYLICLIDAKRARPLVVIDELLNGLHPDAKGLIRDILLSLTPRYQFVMVEYGLDIGTQWIAELLYEGKSTLRQYDGDYYDDLTLKNAREKMRRREKIANGEEDM